MATEVIEIRIINAASWKLKVFNVVCKFLNWATIPTMERNKSDLVIDVTFEIKSGEKK